MRKILFPLVLTVATAAAQNPCTTFPTDSENTDYHVKGFAVQAAFPLQGQTGRLLVKGSDRFRWFKVTDGNGREVLSAQPLAPPNYVALAEMPAGRVQVMFSADNQAYHQEHSLNATAANHATVCEPSSECAVLLYGCFEPFEVDKKSGKAVLNKGKHDANHFMRHLFNKVALEKPALYREELRSEDSSRYGFGDESDRKQAALLKNVKAIIGTGDQVYVDAGYKNQRGKTDISVWQIKQKPMPLVDTNCYATHLNNMYLHFASFDRLQEVFAQKPSFSIWDDHEIRDGWGSQGDEYTDGKLTEPLKTYYMQSRRAFVEHQWMKGPVSNEEIATGLTRNESLHKIFTIGGKSCFMLDLRSERDVNRKQAIGAAQMAAFKQWLQDRT